MPTRAPPQPQEAQNLPSLGRGLHLPQAEIMVSHSHPFSCNMPSSVTALQIFILFYFILFYFIFRHQQLFKMQTFGMAVD